MTTSRDRMSLGILMLSIAGAALGFWLAAEVCTAQGKPNGPVDAAAGSWLFAFVFLYIISLFYRHDFIGK
jgi:lipopolysaccharide export LptBFGC system permease protein LptF